MDTEKIIFIIVAAVISIATVWIKSKKTSQISEEESEEKIKSDGSTYRKTRKKYK